MRFVEDGVDIPDELLWAQDDAKVVFFCGAGVSLAKARLPDFSELTRRVLAKLGVPEDDPARKLFEASAAIEKDYGVQGIASADRVFGQLRRSFDDLQIGKAVRECLTPEQDVDLSAHETILKLATPRSGETRLITTNFDRLFEQARRNLRVCTRSNLPHIKYGDGNWGVVHLHGVVEKDYSSPTSDAFVLSGAEFGEAYLAMGWARDFVKDVLDHYVAVFVGYSADDPPIRYLLEGLQQSGGPSNRAYAFQSVPDDHAVAAWDEKGVHVIPSENGYAKLWESLEAWGERTKNPSAWRSRVLKSGRKGPRNLKPHQRGAIAHIVSSPEGAQSFAAAKPPMSSEWLCVFDPLVRYGEPRGASGRFSDDKKIDPFPRYCLDRDLPPRTGGTKNFGLERAPRNAWSALEPSPSDFRGLEHYQTAYLRGPRSQIQPALPRRIESLSRWIIQVSHEPACLWWACQQISLHPDIIDHFNIGRSASGKNKPQVEEIWTALREYHSLRSPDRDQAYSLKMRLRKKKWHDPLAREYASLFAPSLKIESFWRSSAPPDKTTKLQPKDFLKFSVEYSDAIKTVEVPDEYLKPLIPKLRQGLELASDLEGRYSYLSEICSIEEDDNKDKDEGRDDFRRQYKISGHVLLFASLLRRMEMLDPAFLQREVQSWRYDDEVFSRLRIWALGNLGALNADVYAEELLQLHSQEFWPFRGARDLLLGLASRWDEFSDPDRRLIERKILKGPSKRRGEDAQAHKERSAFLILNRIHWLQSRGCSFTFDFEKKSAKLRALATEWGPQHADGAAKTRDGGGGYVRVETDTTVLAGLKDHEIIPHIQSLEPRSPGRLVEYDPFLGLCENDPERALRALNASLGQEIFVASFWSSIFRKSIRERDEADFTVDLANALISLSDDRFSEIARAVSDWFEDKGGVLRESSADSFTNLWEKFVNSLERGGNQSSSSIVREDADPDWATEAINSTAGNMAELLNRNKGREKFDRGDGMPDWWTDLADQLLDLKGDARRYALVIFGWDLNFLYAVDPKWTEDRLLSVIQDASPSKDDEEALMAGFFWHARAPEYELFKRLKPSLDRIIKTTGNARDRNLESLAGMMLAGWGAEIREGSSPLISDDEMRVFLLEGTPEFRRQVLWILDRWSEDSVETDEESPWSKKVPVFLRDVWPKQKSIRSAEISSGLVELALSQKERFPEVVEIVKFLVSRVDDQRVFLPELRNEENNLSSLYPEAMLELLYAILPESKTRWPHGAESALKAVGQAMPSLRSQKEYIELVERA